MRTEVLSSPKISRKSSEAASATIVLERGGAGRGDGMILIAGAAADANRAYYLSIRFSGMPPAKIMILPSFEA